MKGTALYLTNKTSRKILWCIFKDFYSPNYFKYIGITD